MLPPTTLVGSICKDSGHSKSIIQTKAPFSQNNGLSQTSYSTIGDIFWKLTTSCSAAHPLSRGIPQSRYPTHNRHLNVLWSTCRSSWSVPCPQGNCSGGTWFLPSRAMKIPIYFLLFCCCIVQLLPLEDASITPQNLMDTSYTRSKNEQPGALCIQM